MLRRFLLLALAAIGLTGSAVTAAPAPGARETAVFAGGCFWSMQKAFDHVPQGIISTRAGFMGGHVKNPSYEDVTGEQTGHLEAVEVVFDPTKVSYQSLLDTFWHHTDPTDPRGVICDFAPSYHTAVFTSSDAQFATATASKASVQAFLKKPVVTQIIKASSVALPFYPAEDYHQHYWKTHADHYDSYALGCGRSVALHKLWGKLADVP
jgi:peptide-methionine (S)-S-oxide reductase